MKSFVLSPLHQVEYAVPDLDYAQRFFLEVFGEHEVEADFAAVLTNPALDIRHVGFGGTVQQLCQPLMAGLPHYDALRDHGPCVHNLCYLVDSIDSLFSKSREAGFETLIDFPLTDIWRSVIADDNLQGNHQSYIMDTRALFGFQLEVAETPWINQPQPPLMLPAHGPQWTEVGASSNNTLRAINVVVNDLEATLSALRTLFGANLTVLQPPREHASANDNPDEDAAVSSMLVELGSVPLAYHQPLGHSGELAMLLKEHGPSVHSLVAEVGNLQDIRQRLDARGIASGQLQCTPLSGASVKQPSNSQPVHVHAREKLGVDFILYASTA